MKAYKIEFEKAALQFLRKQSGDVRQRLLTAISKLPYSGDIKRLQGYDRLYRLRVGNYRVLYEKDDVVNIIAVQNIGNRGQIYKKI